MKHIEDISREDVSWPTCLKADPDAIKNSIDRYTFAKGRKGRHAESSEMVSTLHTYYYDKSNKQTDIR
mgnify:CR=1 FL=1